MKSCSRYREREREGVNSLRWGKLHNMFLLIFVAAQSTRSLVQRHNHAGNKQQGMNEDWKGFDCILKDLLKLFSGNEVERLMVERKVCVH